MELQEILGCLGNVQKLDSFPLSTLKAAAKKYPYISQLKELVLIKESSPDNLKDYLLDADNHTPAIELKEVLNLKEVDPSLQIRIVKKERSKTKQKSKKILNLKDDKISPLESILTLVKPGTKQSGSKETKTTLSKVKTKSNSTTVQSKTQKISNKTKTASSSSVAIAKKNNTGSKKVQTPRSTNNAPATKKRTYARKKQSDQIIQVNPINPPLPQWKDILSTVKIEKSVDSIAPKVKKTKASSNTKRAAPSKATSTKTNSSKTTKTTDKKNGTTISLGSSQNEKIKTKKEGTKKSIAKTKKNPNTEKKAPIRSKKARLKFSEWLSEKSNKPEPNNKEKASKRKTKKTLKQLVKSSVVQKEEIATETLAKLYSKQGHTKKAIKVYERLRLLNPEKSSFFAAKIRKLKQK